MQAFMKSNFRAYERLTQVVLIGDPDHTSKDIVTLKINGVSNGKLKQIQINITKQDITELRNLQIFVNNAINFMDDREEAGF